jgi:sugar (pentulose or hexulose) kinase
LSELALTLVLDVGKTRTKVLAIDDHGDLLQSWQRDSRSVDAAAGYRALDTAGLQTWLCETLASMGSLRKSVRSIVPITHGAALAGIGSDGLALPVPDYEFAGFDEHSPDWAARVDPFPQTLSPLLPLGLNAATQLDWLQRHVPDRMAAVEQWMPYAQYLAWWLSGVASSEVSALGCHTLLWNPREGDWSALARREGWAQRFAPLRHAWETLGMLRPELAHSLGLPRGLRVLCGAHDSNACLARYMCSWPRMTLVSSGTWVIVMASGTPLSALTGTGDFLANVSVRGDAVPTGRFMGGRDIERICAGADPALADGQVMRSLMTRGVQAGQSGTALDDRERATLAAMFAAQETVRCVRSLGARGPLTVDGPLAANAVYLEMLAALLGEVHASDDPVEGTARGGYVLARWTDPRPTPPRVRRIDKPVDAERLQAYHAAANKNDSTFCGHTRIGEVGRDVLLPRSLK